MTRNRIITVSELLERVQDHQGYDTYIRFGEFSDDDNHSFQLIINGDDEFYTVFNKLTTIYSELLLESRLSLTIQLLDYITTLLPSNNVHAHAHRILEVGSNMYKFHTKQEFLNELYKLADYNTETVNLLNRLKLLGNF